MSGGIVHVGSGHVFGGIERMLLTLAQVRDGGPPRFALLFDGRLATELRAAGVEVAVVGPARASRPASVRSARRRLRDVLAAWRPQAVVCHGPWVHAIAAPVVRSAGARLGFFAHAPARPWHWTDRWAALHTPDVHFANSAFTASRLGWGVGRTAPVIIHPPVSAVAPPAGSRERLRAALGASDDETVLLDVARIEPGKGQLALVRALARMDAAARWRCWIVGSAGDETARRYRAEVERAIGESGLAGRIALLGERDDVPALLAAADVFCHPHEYGEPFGLAPAEALAAGLPVIASSAGGVVEALAGSGATLVPPGDVDALAEAIRTMLTNPELRRRRSPDVGDQQARRAARAIAAAMELRPIAIAELAPAVRAGAAKGGAR